MDFNTITVACKTWKFHENQKITKKTLTTFKPTFCQWKKENKKKKTWTWSWKLYSFFFFVFYYFATINEEQTDGGETKHKYEIQGKIQIKQPTVILRLLTHSVIHSFIHYFFPHAMFACNNKIKQLWLHLWREHLWVLCTLGCIVFISL